MTLRFLPPPDEPGPAIAPAAVPQVRELAPHLGWQCPLCWTVHAPWVAFCTCRHSTREAAA